MKRFLTFLFASMLAGQTWAQDFTVGNLKYTVSDSANHKVSVIKTESGISGELQIPDTVKYEGVAYSVSTIGHYAFFDCVQLTSVSIPNSVSSIDSTAFTFCDNIETLTYNTNAVGDMFKGLTSLKAVNIGDSVTIIGDEAFFGCYNLKSVKFGNSVANIGNGAFSGCPLTSVTLPNSLTKIGDGAFSGCESLASVNIPDAVTSIGKEAFYSCHSLSSIAIPNLVARIEDETFCHCDQLASVTIGNSAVSIGNKAFYGCDLLTSVDIPDAVTTIGEEAFGGCGLASITIGKSVVKIGEWAFKDCTNLRSVNFSNSVTNIEACSFYGCKGLKSVSIPKSVSYIGQFAFFHCDNLTIYCEAESQPASWNSSWNPDNRPVVWGNKTTAISESETDNLQIYALGRTIVVENATDEIRIYDAIGRLVGRDVARNVSTITVNTTGVYIVKTNNVVKRVMVN